MIVDLPGTSVGAINKRLLQLRQDVGAMALGRVLTLVVVTDPAHAEESLKLASQATHQHPARIVVLVPSTSRGPVRLDGQVRVGGDAGASEVVVLRLFGELTKQGAAVVLPLLLPDSPIVAWWPHDAPKNPASDPIGKLADRRITDSEMASDPSKQIHALAKVYQPGDTDLTWTRTTRWRGILAAALDQPPFEKVVSASVTGGLDSASADLLAGWLGSYLQVPVTRVRTSAGAGLVSARLVRASGEVDLVRPDGLIATLETPGQPTRRLALARRDLAECLSDELARLDPDDIYEHVLLDGLKRLAKGKTMTATEAVAADIAPSIEEARAEAQRLARENSGKEGASMVTRKAPEPVPSTHETVLAKKAEVEQALEQNAGKSAADKPKAKTKSKSAKSKG